MPAKNNTPRSVTWKGRKQTLAAWAAETGIPEPTIRARLDRLKWPPERALTTPADRRFSRSPGRPRTDSPRSAPKLKRHAKGQAFVKWMDKGKRRHRYFGPWGSVRAREGYAAFLREWAEGVTRREPTPARAGDRVAHLVARWLDHAKAKYVKFGKQTSEYHVCRAAAAVLNERFPELPVAAFGLEQLESVRAVMVGKGWVRSTVNKYTARVVACFGWGAARKLVPADVHYALRRIEPLAPGSAAPDPAPIRSAPRDHVAAVLGGEHLHPDAARRSVLASMVRVQLLTGMRPGELCALRPEHLDRSGAEWKYTVPPSANKNHHRDRARVVWFGPRAQAELAPIVAAADGGPVFQFPRVRSVAAGPRPVSRQEYARLVALACDRAGVPRWHPHQLRHNKASDVKHLYESDADAARAIGTSQDVAARIYADPNEEAARRIARATG